ncbi:MAG: hypothetical protein EBY85_04890 [Burkholderiaceae bacterium]|nr:hypothetical protein [Burkholderiaceae bacterium]
MALCGRRRGHRAHSRHRLLGIHAVKRYIQGRVVALRLVSVMSILASRRQVALQILICSIK